MPQPTPETLPVAALSIADFRALIRAELSAALAPASAEPTLVSQQSIAKSLSTTVRTIKNWEGKGLPVVRLPGTCPRYSLAAVRAWLATAAQEKKGANL